MRDIYLHYQKPYRIRLQTSHLIPHYKCPTFATIDVNQYVYPLPLNGISLISLREKTSAHLRQHAVRLIILI